MTAVGKDDRERMVTNNPAMTAPATQVLSRQTRQRVSDSDTHRTDGEHVVVADPAGDIEKVVTESSEEVSKYDVGWRRIVRNFSPSWFSVTMSTGIVSLMFITIPWKTDWLYWLSVSFFGFNTLLFALAVGISIVRYSYPGIWNVMINDPTNSLFLGTVPIGLATLIESWLFLCCPYWGNWSVTFAWVLWMIDSVAAIGVTVAMMFKLISSTNQQSLDRITAAHLLPIAATIVASAAGGEIAEVLNRFNPEYALGTMLFSYIMWGMSVPFAMMVLVLYFSRLYLHKLPPREIIVSSFLPLGPLGMGGYAISILGQAAKEILPHVEFLSHIPLSADILYVLGTFIQLIMWSFGIVWGVFACATITRTPSFPFNMGWWGFVFPLSAMAISTIQMGIVMPSLFFRVLGTVLCVIGMILWVIVAAGTVRGMWSGKLFYAPCLKNLPKHGDTEKNASLVAKP